MITVDPSMRLARADDAPAFGEEQVAWIFDLSDLLLP
jgi:hypothetical protein